MFDGIDDDDGQDLKYRNNDDEHEKEEQAYKQGIQDAKADPEVRHQIADLGRVNFTRGHNAGLACGLMLGVLLSSPLEQEENVFRKEIEELVKKMTDLEQKTSDYQPETVYQKVVDEDEEEEDEEIRDSFRTILVNLVSKFVEKFSVNDQFKTLLPKGHWDYLCQLVQDNKDGSPDKQTPIMNLIQQHSNAKNDDGYDEEQNPSSAIAPKSSRKPGLARSAKPERKKTVKEVLDW